MIPKYLHLTPAQAEATEKFNEAWDDIGPGNCDGNPGPWQDYTSHDYPRKEEREYMCAGCPVFDECAAYAKVLKPTYGVWAGKLYAGKTEGRIADEPID